MREDNFDNDSENGEEEVEIFTLIDEDEQESEFVLIKRIDIDGQSYVAFEPYREDGDASSQKLNEVIRELVNPASPDTPELKAGNKLFRVNDRVMQNKNKGTVSNGDVGFVRAIKQNNNGDYIVTIEFSDSRFVDYAPSDLGIIELAYAITIHKAMGSEYETVIIPVLSAHMVLLCRNLIYTAITRAKKRVFLVGQKSALFIAIHRNKISKRNTMLGSRIEEYYRSFTDASKTATENLKLAG